MTVVFVQLIIVLSVLPTIEERWPSGIMSQMQESGNTGSSDVFRVVGGSVQLEINGSVSEFDDFSWIFSGTVNVLKYSKKYKDVTHSPDYEHRVEFNEETCSLTLKNLQKTDSGLYKIEVSNALQTTTLHTYRLSVLDPVEPPVLNVYSSTDPCNSTLTCRGHDLSITSTCYKETCEEKEVTSPGGIALFLSVRDSVIICNYSNPASWKQDKITFTHLCPDTGTEPPEVHSGSHWTVGILVFLGVLGILVPLVVGYCKNQQRGSADSRQMEMEDTVNAGGERNDQPLSPEAETDSNEFSTVNPQHPANNGASGH